MAPDSRRFIQFPHPGGEHWPDRPGEKDWNPLYDRRGRGNGHARKFIQTEGSWLDQGTLRRGYLWAWAEWEPESTLIRELDAVTPRHPHFLWQPHWSRKTTYAGLHNTDPFIYGGFYYTDCKQLGRSLAGLRSLDLGSVIVFGSMKKPHWVVDTVFVVADYIEHSSETYRDRLAGLVPDCYWNVTLKTTYQWPETTPRRLYRGATYDRPHEGMFSFFPCAPAGIDKGFERPRISLPSQYFTETLAQGARGHALGADPVPIDVLQELWTSIADQVQAQGLCLGVSAAVPPQV